MVRTLSSILVFLMAAAIATFAGTRSAASASYSDVSAAVSAALPGDTVQVPAGSATWSSTLTITKGVSLRGAGAGATIVTSGGGNRIVAYVPDAASRSGDVPFDVSGFTFEGGGVKVDGMIYITADSTHPITKVTIHDNKFDNTNNSGTAIYIDGAVYGVAYSNAFLDIAIVLRGLANNRQSWDNEPFAFGDSRYFYFEDNTISFTKDCGFNGWVEGGHGGRYVLRYNTWNMTNTTSFLDVHDMHGNQSLDGALYATIIAEVYGNIYTGMRAGRWMCQRGGRLLMFNNLWTGTNGLPWTQVREEYDDVLSPTNSNQVQHVNNSYFWNNWANGAEIPAEISQANANDPQPSHVNPLVENVSFWNYKASFTGSAGIGAGSAAPTMSLTAGVGYWVTGHVPAGAPPTTMADLKTYCQAGRFYTATATNTWALLYAPYAYPHPLRSLASPPGDSGSGPNPPTRLRIKG